MSGCSASSSPSLVPFAVQTGAKAPGFSPTAPEFTAETDSPLEGAGFEPSVPRESNGENAKEPVSPLERKMPEMSSTQHRPKVVDLYKRLFSRLKARVSIRCCKSTE